jgi:hypothetical protein
MFAIVSRGTRVGTADPPPTVPDPPTNLSATPSNGQVSLTWSAPSSNGGSAITSYTVTNSPTGGTVNIINTSATITGLTNGTLYTFTVIAVNSVGSSSGTTVNATPFTTPSAPTGVTATAGNGLVNVNWNTAVSNGSTITGYRIERSQDQSTWNNFLTTTSTSIQFSGLTNGIIYYFRVITTSSNAGNSPVSSTASATPFTTPSAPTNLNLTVTNGVISATWTAPSNNGGSPIIEYFLYAYALQSPVTYPSNRTITSATINVITADYDRPFEFRVAAKNSVDYGPFSTTVNLTINSTVPSQIASIGIVYSNDRVDLSWNIPFNGGSNIIDYLAQGYIVSSNQLIIEDYIVNNFLVGSNFGSLIGQQLRISIRARNSIGLASTATDIYFIPFTTPSAPTINSATRGLGAITVNWTPGTLNGSTLSRYIIERSLNEFSGFANAKYTTNAFITVSGLDNNTLYYFRVFTESSNAGTSVASNVVNQTTFGVPGLPTALSATPRNGRIDLSWTAPSDTGGTPIRDYEIRRNTAPVVTLTTTNTFAIITGLTNSITYSFDVRARNDVGYSSYSAISSAKPFTIPGAPKNVNATAGNAEATINWTAPNITSTFTIDGSSTFIAPMSGTVEVLIVGGGGGGGPRMGGGGGGGGVIYMPSVNVTVGTNYSIFVGAGGPSGTKGENSSVFGAIAAGGGTSTQFDTGPGTSGGSGGGAAANQYSQYGSGIIHKGGDSSGNSLGENNGVIYGSSGGSMTALRIAEPSRAAGGGGAGGPGLNTNPNTIGNTGQTGEGSGGIGVINAILGISYYWGGGGGGSNTNGAGSNVNTGGYGGLGGGGGGASEGGQGIGGGSALISGMNGGSGANTNGGAGGPNTGGGGGGGAWVTGQGGQGGSGIVVIRYINIVDTTITSYTVTRTPGGQTVITNGSTTATFNGLTNGTAYTFTVVAKNSDDGISPLSAQSASITPISATVPTKPLNLTGTPSVGFVDLSWNAPSSDGGSNIISYTIQTSTNQSLWTDSSSHFSERFKRISNLANGVLHYFRVYAINLVGNSPFSDLFSTTPIVFFTLDVTQNFVGGRLDISNNYTQQDISFNWYSSINNSFTNPILLSNPNNRKYLFIRLEYQKLYIRCTINYNTNTFTTSFVLIPEKYNPQLFDYNINIYTVGQKQSLFNTATYNYSNANIPPVFNIELNLNQLSTFLSSSRSITSASNSLINTNAFETSMRPFGERLLEIVAVKIFGHPKTRAAISNDNSFYNTTQISTQIYNTFNNHRNELGNYFMGLYDITQVNNNAQLINVSNLNIIFPFFFRGTTQKNTTNLFRNGPNVGGSLLVNGNYNIPLLLTFN